MFVNMPINFSTIFICQFFLQFLLSIFLSHFGLCGSSFFKITTTIFPCFFAAWRGTGVSPWTNFTGARRRAAIFVAPEEWKAGEVKVKDLRKAEGGPSLFLRSPVSLCGLFIEVWMDARYSRISHTMHQCSIHESFGPLSHSIQRVLIPKLFYIPLPQNLYFLPSSRATARPICFIPLCVSLCVLAVEVWLETRHSEISHTLHQCSIHNGSEYYRLNVYCNLNLFLK